MTERMSPQKAPYVQDTAPGAYAWCACGRSGSQPFCDGSHAGTGLGPRVHKLTERKTVAWCGCKHTGNPPLCDGSHARL